MSDKIELTEDEARAYALALARGTETTMLNDAELHRVMETGAEWKVHAALHALIMAGEVDLRWKQRGAGALEIMPRGRDT